MSGKPRMQAWIIYGGSPGWWNATLVLENGWAPFGHLCSDPVFMPGDLLLNRPERKAVFQRMGVEIEIMGSPIAGSNSPEVPKGLIERHQNESNWRAFANAYEQISAELQAEKEVTRVS